MKRFFRFLKEARAELRKVSWPTWESVSRSTVIVFVAIIIFTLFIFVVDMGVDKVMRLVMVQN